MGYSGENEPKRKSSQLLVVLGFPQLDLRLDYACPDQPLVSGGGRGIVESVIDLILVDQADNH